MTAQPSLNKKNNVKWTVRDSKVNLAALLNDPRKVKRDYDLFTKTWGETFRELPADATLRRSKWIPNVQNGHFSDYLLRNGDHLIRHNGQSLKHQTNNGDEDQTYSNLSNFGSKSSMIKTAVSAQQEREAVIKTRLALDKLPKLFLRSDFDMGNPQVFGAVLTVCNTDIEKNAVAPTKEQNTEIWSSRLLQEKLNHYLDRVEMAIVRQISLQSDAFFKAMESHEELHEYLNKTMGSVQNLIAKLKLVKKNVADNSLKVLHLHRTHVNSLNLLQRLQMMVTVHQTQPTIQLLLSTSEYAGSLDLIRTTQEVLHQELAGLQCFRHLSCQLTEMERVIGQMMRQEMDECLRDEIHRSVTEGHVCRDPHRLSAVMLGLLRQGQFEFLQDFREEIENAVKSIIRDTVADAVEDYENNKSETLASKMRMLEFIDWISMLNQLFDNLLVFLKRVKGLLDRLANVALDSLARGDIFRTKRIKKIDRIILKKRTRLKSSSAQNATKPTPEEEESNPFLDSSSNSDSNEESNNPFLNGAEKNPFVDSPEHNNDEKKSNIESNNPFLNDHLVPDGGDDLMDGLASYEDELISSAADSFIPSSSNLTLSHPGTSYDPPEEKDFVSNPAEKSEENTVVEEAMSSEECDGFIFALKDFLHWTFEFEQDRCVKVLIAKGKDSSLDKLSSSDFLQLAKSIERFSSEAEEVVTNKISDHNNDKQRSVGSSLRGALQTQAGRFISRFHEERRNKLSLILDNEIWKQAEVPLELSKLLSNLVGGKISTTDHNDDGLPSVNGDVRDQCKVVEYLELGGEHYAVAGTVLILLKMVTEYCKCADDLPASAPDLINRLRDLLTLFNSRTCQLVLGAGALQLVGLKTITTKHLALASRCLQLVLHCIPSIKRHFEVKLVQLNQSNDEKLPNKNLGVLRHFDHVTKDFQDHVNEVENKLTTIVMSVMERCLTKWEVKAPVPSPAFRSICKQITKFYDTVSFLLPTVQICRILTTLNNELKNRLRILLLRYNVRNNGGPQHGLVTSDLTYYEVNIKSLKGMEGIDLQLTAVWS